ncbi:lysosome membrane protein 2-like [Aricia agestis]|uniref:lysosome membrane protein 2-like n=1 Tax=Aricia agestis TaxID=91739 RepID=UPI001C209009|nr:lysosome membrane protein 2-like [Aricia agestis]
MKCNKGNTPNTKLLSLLSVVFLILPIISLVINPLMLIIKNNLRIYEGSFVYNLMVNESKSVTVRVYLFNVTNPEEFLSGEDDKLRLSEVGPFTYQEYRWMEDPVLDEEAGVMGFTLRTRPEFVPEESVGDPMEVNVTAPNMISLAVASKVGTFPYFTKTGFSIFLNSIKSKPIINERAYNLMWGYDEPLLSMGRKLLPFVDFDSLAMLKRLFDPRTRIKIATNNEDKFRILTVDNSSGVLTRGYGDENKRGRCNTYEDTYEGIGFPFGLKPGRKLRIYRDVLCRIIDLEYVDTENIDYGPEVMRYQYADQVYGNTEANDCLCQASCIDGVTDMSPCFYGLGVGISNAHFLHANSSLYERIVGMNPDEKKHGSEFLIDTITGSVLKTRFSLQVNIVVDDVNYNSKFKPFSKMVVPYANVIVEHQAPDETKEQFKIIHNIAPIVIHCIEAIVFIIGASILVYLFYSKFTEILFPRRNFGYHMPKSIILEKSDSIYLGTDCKL